MTAKKEIVESLARQTLHDCSVCHRPTACTGGKCYFCLEGKKRPRNWSTMIVQHANDAVPHKVENRTNLADDQPRLLQVVQVVRD